MTAKCLSARVKIRRGQGSKKRRDIARQVARLHARLAGMETKAK